MKSKSVRNLLQMKQGECFSAIITDIVRGQVTLRLLDGGKLVARTFLPPEAHIGEVSTFIVRENNGKGTVKLEFVKSGLDSDENSPKRLFFDMRV